MTVALALVGICHVLTALGLAAADPVGRSILACGGCATIAVAVIPLGGAGQSRLGHAFFTAVAFLALAAWPALAGRRGVTVPFTLRPRIGVAVAAVLLALVGRTGAELALDGPAIGLWERAAAGAESGWPLVCVLGVLVARRSGAAGHPPR
jgi:hypothetical protein